VRGVSGNVNRNEAEPRHSLRDAIQ
jgi:hypothetical protein